MILITLMSTLVTFFIGNLFYKELHTHPLRLGNNQIHHSLLGILLIILGFFINGAFGIISAIGLGIYLSHVFEEILLNKVPVLKAIFIFVTKI